MSRSLPPSKPDILLRGFIIRETPKAILFQIQAVNDIPVLAQHIKQAWFPRSQTSRIENFPRPQQDVIKVSAWIWGEKKTELYGAKDPCGEKMEDPALPDGEDDSTPEELEDDSSLG